MLSNLPERNVMARRYDADIYITMYTSIKELTLTTANAMAMQLFISYHTILQFLFIFHPSFLPISISVQLVFIVSHSSFSNSYTLSCMLFFPRNPSFVSVLHNDPAVWCNPCPNINLFLNSQTRFSNRVSGATTNKVMINMRFQEEVGLHGLPKFCDEIDHGWRSSCL